MKIYFRITQREDGMESIDFGVTEDGTHLHIDRGGGADTWRTIYLGPSLPDWSRERFLSGIVPLLLLNRGLSTGHAGQHENLVWYEIV